MFSCEFCEIFKNIFFRASALSWRTFFEDFSQKNGNFAVLVSTQTLIQKLVSLVQIAKDSNKCLENSKTQIVLEKRINKLFVSKRLKI